ncbi:hypothetical protein EV385_4547 [Krasilnikovia cinnamomea]|uniref:Uncharacterized protein n=1 Tax=Krasilnikovia cinnamomea TaxID=349313 RepID=A0A4Q7ZQL6_9ACTN|nr:hypothetical protein [Krasilnikovia cinnamomea]RZU52669.1 hypothetical protein EV385_4547 [Krasilnikovia cinnamomea]
MSSKRASTGSAAPASDGDEHRLDRDGEPTPVRGVMVPTERDLYGRARAYVVVESAEAASQWAVDSWHPMP